MSLLELGIIDDPDELPGLATFQSRIDSEREEARREHDEALQALGVG
jgi:hypothetical protein